MKKVILVIIACFGSIEAIAEEVSTTAIAKWQTSAFKDTSSALVITPLSSLNFKYTEGNKSFNKELGKFNVTLKGVPGSTDFKLTSKLISDELVRFDDPSKLKVAVNWNGKELSKAEETVLISTDHSTRSGLSSLANKSAYSANNRESAEGLFGFSIKNATNTSGQNTDFSKLKDGTWNGEVAIQFTAVWIKP
ncbi:common pilus major fimbrillin subunit EcpA [Acinetobacter rudis]|uniref:Common pilus major fimbrillin subunit EcpA n=1 Tax=Acinetobacter rudis TaxID=632955 RepID=A0AAW8J652_9GAMM|nr:common pilus major fimbrillin subunit EcpA [Acinetobacter rudis]MDQ8934903.1 common pilus major fimbrillin subunit EcpA [Acinetobacter rudis]MDQ8952870.1 common pilus major fimbrillin subunit EcpA [Acinetobacter rudis]MDQ9017304.1 common pilus major fimbrillin subunit EcpA [Acinetobacter rudis]